MPPQSPRPPDLDAQGNPVGSGRPPDLDANGQPIQSRLVDPKTGTTYQPGTMEMIPHRSLTPAGSLKQVFHESEEQQAESNRLAAEHPILTTAAMVAAGGGPRAVQALRSGGPIAVRAAGVARAAVAGAAPIAKYEAVKAGLEWAGIPAPAAAVIAAGVTGYGGKSTAKEPAANPATKPVSTPKPSAPATAPTAAPGPVPAAAPKVASAATPASAAPTPAQTAPPTPTVAPKPSALSASQIADQVQKAAAKARVDLSPSEHVKAFRMVRDEGVTAADAVAKVGGTPRPVTVPAAGLQMTANEVKEYVRLVKAGKTQADAVKAIKALRAFRSRTGAMSTEQMESEIAARVGNRSPTR